MDERLPETFPQFPPTVEQEALQPPVFGPEDLTMPGLGTMLRKGAVGALPLVAQFGVPRKLKGMSREIEKNMMSRSIAALSASKAEAETLRQLRQSPAGQAADYRLQFMRDRAARHPSLAPAADDGLTASGPAGLAASEAAANPKVVP